jgi:hypothetical protein
MMRMTMKILLLMMMMLVNIDDDEDDEEKDDTKSPFVRKLFIEMPHSFLKYFLLKRDQLIIIMIR